MASSGGERSQRLYNRFYAFSETPLGKCCWRSALECGTSVPLSASHLAGAYRGPTRAGSKLPAAKAGASSRTPKVAASNIDNFLSMFSR